MIAFQKFNILHYLYSVNKRGRFVAHCLDFDLVATANDMAEANQRLDTLVKFHIESFLNSNGLSGLNRAAPKEFFDEFTDALRNGRMLPDRTLRIDVPEPIPMAMPYGELEVIAGRAA
jgi:hypothetical protein